MSKTTDLLQRLEVINNKVVEHNRRENELQGFKKAKVSEIERTAEALSEQGISVKLVKTKDGLGFTKKSMQEFAKVVKEFKEKLELEANKLEEFFTAVENKDFDKIKEITGEDVSQISFDVELTDTDTLKEETTQMKKDILEEGISGVSNEEVLDFEKAPKKDEPVAEAEDDEAEDLEEIDLGDTDDDVIEAEVEEEDEVEVEVEDEEDLTLDLDDDDDTSDEEDEAAEEASEEGDELQDFLNGLDL